MIRDWKIYTGALVVAMGVATALPATPTKGYDIYVVAQQKEAEFEEYSRQVKKMPDWKNSPEGYQLRVRPRVFFELYRDACQAGYGLGCVDMARLSADSPGMASIFLSQGCAQGYRPACKTDSEIAGLAANEDARAGIFRGPGSLATAEENRLKSLCDKSQWSNCLGFSKLAAPRLLKNCELGNQDSCVEYANKASVYNLAELRPIWESPQALPAMRRLCKTWTPDKGEFKTYCGLPDRISAEVLYQNQPSTAAGTTLLQRQKCVTEGRGKFLGSRRVKTGQVGIDRNGDGADVTEIVYDYGRAFYNQCRSPINGKCVTASRTTLLTLSGRQSTESCESFEVQ